MIAWIKDFIWEYQFAKVPVEQLNGMPVKFFRGSYYYVNEKGEH